jgi:membrane protease subunit HflK
VQYRLKDVTSYLFEISDPDASVQRVAETAIRDVIGTSTFDYVIGEGRADIAQKATELMQQMLDNYKSGIAVTSVNLLSANPPEEVKAAYDDAIKAREDEQRKINEAEAYSNEVTERAAGNADFLDASGARGGAFTMRWSEGAFVSPGRLVIAAGSASRRRAGCG